MGVIDILEKVIEDKVLREGVRRASLNAEEAVSKLLASRRELEELAKHVREVRRKSILRIRELVEEAIKNLSGNGAKVYLAENSRDALEYIGKIVGSGKLVVLSKTMTGEELGLRRFLEELGNEVWETDLGQLLVQVSDTKPMHIVAPAVHLTREEAAKLVREKLGLRIESDAPEEIVSRVKEFLRDKLLKADVGISGANAVAANPGAIVLVENEGNIRLITGLPRKHVVITGVEKIVPTLLDAIAQVLVQAAYAGVYPTSYINVITGPSSTADIEHKRVIGAQGPQELYVVFIDNGRLRAIEYPLLREQLKCVRCGRCQFACPIWNIVANHWGGRAYGGPMGLGWTAIVEGVEKAAELAMLCLGCMRCDEVCPMEIPLSAIAHWLKTVYVSR